MKVDVHPVHWIFRFSTAGNISHLFMSDLDSFCTGSERVRLDV